MSRIGILALAGAAVLASNAVLAADLPIYAPPEPVESGWYLRGFIGMSNQQFRNLSHPSFAAAAQFTWLDNGGFDSAPFYGVGFGYQWNNWLRTDVTGEYRGKAGFHALDRYFNAGTYFSTDYTASKSEWVGLFNAYIDLGTWWHITPFVGAGVGFAYNQIEHFRDTNVIAGGGGWAGAGSKTNLAWAVHAGASYRASSNFAVELSYRYMYLGDAQTGTLVNLDPTLVSGNPLAPMTFNRIYSHDVMLGVRWLLQPERPYAPLVRKG